jgi:class 3 adenylate cyclase
MDEPRVDRRLAAILAGDIAGYSQLMGADEEGTLRQLKAHRKELVDPKITEHRGRIVKTTGDGMLVEFVSVVDAVRCAVDIQRGMADRNTSVPAQSRIQFRIGINVGDIISDDNDIYGDGVNVAARLEGLAEPGGIMVSRNVYDQVRDKLSFGFEDMGEQTVKNIARPISVLRISLAESVAPIVVKSATATTKTEPSTADRPSIAVLPFANMSGDPEQEYFADGISEDLITGLSKLRWFFVIARNSSFTYKGKAVDISASPANSVCVTCWRAASARAATACASLPNSSTPRPTTTSGPTATTARWPMFSSCRTKLRRRLCLPSNPNCSRRKRCARKAVPLRT